MTASAFFENYRNQLSRDAELRLTDQFVQSLQALTDALKSPLFDINASRRKIQESALSAPPGAVAKVEQGQAAKSNAEVPANQVVSEAYNVVKPYLLQLGEDAQLLRMWVVLNVPKIEDGNNFGVAVQEEVMLEASKTEADVTSMLDFYCDYLLYRGKISSKMLKWPGVRAFAEALAELDEMTYVRIRMTLQDIRNNYARLYDIFVKNINKIRNPRSEAGMDAVNIMY